MKMKSKKSKKTDISKKVKEEIWDRDNHRCIFCGSAYAMPNVHVIPRSKGGLGIPENVVTGCLECHRKMDQSTKRNEYLERANAYLDKIYGARNIDDLVFKKF